MKKAIRSVLWAAVTLILLALVAVGVLRAFFDIDVFDRSGWHETKGGGLQYRLYDGTPLSGWQTVDGDIYYFDPAEDCTAATGWQTVGGFRYYMGVDGRTAVGWTEVAGSRYFFGETGVMATGWLKAPEGRYYLGEGAMHTGWLTLPEGTFLLGEDGIAAIGWTEHSGKTYYFREDGSLHTGWLELPEGRYYLEEDGSLHTGRLELPEGCYWLGEDGRMTVGWFRTEGCWYYADPKGLLHTGWLTLDGKRYYFDSTGAMATGWLELADGIRYLDRHGVMQTGWLELGGKTYYLKPSGLRYSGWMHTEEGSYYFREDGVMAKGRVEIDGVTRHFDSTGKYVVLVNRWNFIPEDYEVELVDFRGFKVAAEARDAMEQMVKDCNAAGYYCGVNHVYRTHAYQDSLWSGQVARYMAQGYSREWAEETTSKSIAVPGTSEHQLGLAIDVGCGQDAYGWLMRNSWKYGLIMRYPYGDTEWTGILYEPWHYRYVGVELAKELYDLGLCLEEYMDMLTRQAGYEPAA